MNIFSILIEYLKRQGFLRPMGKRGVVFLLALVVIIVLSVLSSAFFTRSISENNLVRRYVNSTEAFWRSEEGLARAIASLPPSAPTPIDIGDPITASGYNYTIANDYPGASSILYQIASTGRVVIGVSIIIRTIEAFVLYTPFAAGKFLKAIEVNGTLSLLGATDIKPDDKPDSDYYTENAGITFLNRLGITVDALRGYAQALGTYYEDPSPASGIEHNLNNVVTWIKITNPGDQLKLPKENWVGSGILVVEGNTDIAGGTFNGIVWIRGQLMITGNFINNGTIIAESGATVTKVAGTPVLTWDAGIIAKVLLDVDDMSPRKILSWREVP